MIITNYYDLNLEDKIFYRRAVSNSTSFLFEKLVHGARIIFNRASDEVIKNYADHPKFWFGRNKYYVK